MEVDRQISQKSTLKIIKNLINFSKSNFKQMVKILKPRFGGAIQGN